MTEGEDLIARFRREMEAADKRLDAQQRRFIRDLLFSIALGLIGGVALILWWEIGQC